VTRTPGPRPFPHRLRPPLWARGGHAQTILGHVLPLTAPPIGETAGDRRREIPLEDGDRLVVLEREPTAPRPRPTRVHLFHGLSGGTDSDYMQRLAAGLAADGHGVWAVNHRGAGPGEGLATGVYHSGRSDDMQAILAASRADAPGLLHLVVGVSLSGNIALKLLAEGREPAPDGAIAINPPCDLEDCSVRISRGLNRLYDLRFVHRLRRAVAERAASEGVPTPVIPRTATLWDLDELVTAPRGGFADARDYYARCSTIDRLTDIARPAVLITAADDPFVDAARVATAPRSPLVHLHVEPTGGHVGYLERRGLGYGCWLTRAVRHYTDELSGA